MQSNQDNQIDQKWENIPEEELRRLIDRCYNWLESFIHQCRRDFKLEPCIGPLMQNNKDLPGSPFWSNREGPMTTENLMNFILSNWKLDPSDKLFIQLYLFQLLAKLIANKNSKMDLASLNHLTKDRIFVALLLCASKFYLERYCNNDLMAKITGLQLNEVILIETELMKLLDWNLFPTISPQQTVELLCNLTCPSWKEVVFDKEEKFEDLNHRFKNFFKKEQDSSSSLSFFAGPEPTASSKQTEEQLTPPRGIS